ncbi:hypothetical protein [Mucilaginibacter sp. OK283]|uniref:hypothetical protein n=1 Tax=Mucilaginibacter sp. OK283 TaxID=1881049 RepID=UPI0008BF5D85|nr:hypothetical protein [Mucilaginibacter sp. OK283]SEP15341.1 hypothetical protein SAMN05428947_107225 [Mucilaginibacter sp. OK283]
MSMNNETWENQDSNYQNARSVSANNGDAYNANRYLEDDGDDLDEEFDVSGEYPNETPEERKTRAEGVGSHSQAEVDQPDRGADTSYSEQTDVTPPNKKEFPSVGPAKTDFASRPQGRTTGRMVGHEPGTEGI